MIQVQNDRLVPIYGPKGFISKLDYPMIPWDKRH
jgi:hypothetical protein